MGPGKDLEMRDGARWWRNSKGKVRRQRKPNVICTCTMERIGSTKSVAKKPNDWDYKTEPYIQSVTTIYSRSRFNTMMY